MTEESSKKRHRRRARSFDEGQKTQRTRNNNLMQSDQQSITKNPTRFVPDQKGFSALTSTETRSDFHQIEHPEVCYTYVVVKFDHQDLTDSEVESEEINMAYRSQCPPDRPESSVAKKKERYLRWIKTPTLASVELNELLQNVLSTQQQITQEEAEHTTYVSNLVTLQNELYVLLRKLQVDGCDSRVKCLLEKFLQYHTGGMRDVMSGYVKLCGAEQKADVLTYNKDGELVENCAARTDVNNTVDLPAVWEIISRNVALVKDFKPNSFETQNLTEEGPFGVIKEHIEALAAQSAESDVKPKDLLDSSSDLQEESVGRGKRVRNLSSKLQVSLSQARHENSSEKLESCYTFLSTRTPRGKQLFLSPASEFPDSYGGYFPVSCSEIGLEEPARRQEVPSCVTELEDKLLKMYELQSAVLLSEISLGFITSGSSDLVKQVEDSVSSLQTAEEALAKLRADYTTTMASLKLQRGADGNIEGLSSDLANNKSSRNKKHQSRVKNFSKSPPEEETAVVEVAAVTAPVKKPAKKRTRKY